MFLSFKLSNGTVVEGSVNKTAVVIGRSNKADFVVPDESLSRIHCLVEIENGNFFITDLKSANGVFLDGNRISPDQKTLFTTFMQITVGMIEASFRDDDESLVQTTAEPKEVHQSRSNISAITKATHHHKPTPHPVKKPQNKNKHVSLPLVGGLLVVVLAGVYYLQTYQEPGLEDISENQTEALTELYVKPRSEMKHPVPLDFSGLEMYQNFESKKNCQILSEVCEEFKLQESDNEGVIIENKEAYVYLNPSSFYEVPHLSFLKQAPHGAEVLAHYLVLKSTLMNKMYAHELDQITLLMMNDEKKMIRAFRYPVSHFNEGNDNRFRYLELVNNAFLTHNLDEVSALLKQAIPSKDLSVQ